MSGKRELEQIGVNFNNEDYFDFTWDKGVVYRIVK